MNTPTFKEQFDKITSAYFEDELRVYQPCACFIGNLLNGNQSWYSARTVKDNVRTITDNLEYLLRALECLRIEASGYYSIDEIMSMEANFMNTYELGYSEDSLFKAMDSTLDMLRKIHESKGEIIESFEFKQRQLA